MQVYQNTLEMIGRTPLLEIKNIDTGCCQLFLKLENQNPGGSIKDRIALQMIKAAEASGELKPGGTLIEATAGNTGLGLALIAALKNYRLIIIMPDKMSQEKVAHLRALGAEVIMTRSDVVKGHPDYYQDMAARLATEIPGAFYVNQFNNPNNPLAHELTTAPEIWQQMDEKVDAFVYGVGSSGGITGISRYLKQKNPQLTVIAADPVGSIIAPLVETGETIVPGSWFVEGIGEDFVPDICDLNLIDRGISVSDQEALLCVRELLRKEGILAGSSTGTHLYAALKYCREQTIPQRVVTIACDTGNKYLSKQFNDNWMRVEGFLEQSSYNDLRDLIANSHQQHAMLYLQHNEPLKAALTRMKNHHISQLPVLKQNKVIGLLTEKALLDCIEQRADALQLNAEQAIALTGESVISLPPTASITELKNCLKANSTVLIADQQACYGLITRIDLINYLVKKG